MELSANLSLLFPELPFQERIPEAAKFGFKSVEFWFPFEYGGKTLVPLIKAAGVQVVLFNLDPGDVSMGEWGTLGIPGREDHFRFALEQALELANVLGCIRLNALAGIRPPGIDVRACFDTIRSNLAWAAQVMPKSSKLLIESLNPHSNRDYLLPAPEQAIQIVREINHPVIGFQFDVYHAYEVRSDIFGILCEHLPIIGHIQVADSPGRHQPGTGEIPFTRFFNEIQNSGYRGAIGLEYKPLGKTEDSLSWCKQWLK
jgi:hydroxypyruvate isomerase